MNAQYLRVRNWEKFQHYKDRNPPWIKNYLDIDDPSHPFSSLSYADQGRLQKIWRWAAKVDNRIPYDMVTISRYLGGKPDAVCRAIDGYLAGEWLQVGSQKELTRLENAEKRAANRKKVASTRLATRKRSATPEVETEKETEKDSRPVADIESVGAAIALCEAIPDVYQDAGTRKVILAYADELQPADFHAVREELEARDDVRNAAKWVNGALKRRAMRKAAA